MNKTPSIILVSGKHPIHAKSGYASYAKSLAGHLTKIGYDVHIFCIGRVKNISEESFGTVHTVAVPFLSFLSGREMVGLLPYSFYLFRNISKYIVNDNSPIIWGIGPWSLAGVTQRALRIADYFTTIRHENTFTPWNFRTVLAKLFLIPFYAMLELVLLKRADIVVTHYTSTEKILTREFGMMSFSRLPYAPPHQASVIRSPVAIPEILTVCRQDWRKGVSYLLEAFARLRAQGVRFGAVIVGGGSLLETHKTLVQTLRLSNVKFTGQIDNISRYLSRASLFILPSLEEGSGSLALLEAMAAGLPIVATNVDGIPEDIENGKSGLLVPPKDTEALAGAIQTLLINPKRADALGRTARKHYNRKYAQGPLSRSLAAFLSSSARHTR